MLPFYNLIEKFLWKEFLFFLFLKTHVLRTLLDLHSNFETPFFSTIHLSFVALLSNLLLVFCPDLLGINFGNVPLVWLSFPLLLIEWYFNWKADCCLSVHDKFNAIFSQSSWSKSAVYSAQMLHTDSYLCLRFSSMHHILFVEKVKNYFYSTENRSELRSEKGSFLFSNDKQKLSLCIKIHGIKLSIAVYFR